MDFARLFRELRQRKLVQILVLYVGGSWGVLQAVSLFQSTYSWPRAVMDVTLVVLGCGLLAAGTLGWFHGERGHQRVTRLEVVILSVLLLVTVAGSWGLALRAAPAASGLDDAAPAPLAVLPFENRTGDASKEWLQRGVAEMLTTDLGQNPRLRVVSGERVADLLKQQGVGESGVAPGDVALKVASRARAAHYVSGGVYASGGQLRLDVRLVSVADNTVAASAHAEGPDIFPLVDSVAAELSAELAPAASAGAAAPPAPAPLAQVTTGNLEAYREYHLGLAAERNLRLGDALPHFRRAVALDSTFAQALTHLGLAEFRNGAFGMAGLHLTAARANLPRASQRDRLSVEGLLALVQGDAATAEARFEELTRLYPDDKNAFVLLALLYRDDPRKRDQQEPVLRQVLRLDPYYAPAYGSLAYVYLQRRDYVRADSCAARYAALQPTEPSGPDTQGEIYERSGRYQQARSAFLGALRLSPAYGAAMVHLVRNARRYGRLEDVPGDLAAYTRRPDPAVRASALLAVAHSYAERARMDEALATYQQAYDAAGAGAPELRTRAQEGLASGWNLLGQYGRTVQLLQGTVSPLGMTMWPYLEALGELRRFAALDSLRASVAALMRRPEMAATASGALEEVDGEIAYYRGDWPRCLESLRQARQLLEIPAGQLADAREVLALVKTGRAAEAVPLVQGAGREGVPDPPLLRLRGLVYEAAGRRADAAAAFRELLALWPPAAVQRFPAYRDIPVRLARLGG